MITNVVITDASVLDTLSTLEEKLPQSSRLDTWAFPHMRHKAENHPLAPCQPEETQKKDRIYIYNFPPTLQKYF